MSLAKRRRLPELMDDPGLSRELHFRALAGLSRLNGWSGSVRIIWRAIRSLQRDGNPASLRILDLATGAGDIPIDLWRRARRSGMTVEIDACDISPVALEYARRRSSEHGASIRFFECDALMLDCVMEYDVVISSLFLHHLTQDQATKLLRVMSAATRRMVLVNDLVRSSAGYALARAATRVLTRSHVVHVDGPRSVESAFTSREALRLAKRAGLIGAGVVPKWPCRFLLTWVRQ